MIQAEGFRTRAVTFPFAIALATIPARASTDSNAHPPREKALVVEHADIVSLADGRGMAAYLAVWNGTPKTLLLVAVESDGFGSISLHRTESSGGVSRMRPVDGGLEIPPGTELMMKPDGVHAMMASPGPGLSPKGDTALTLVFADGTRVGTRAEFLAPGTRARDHHHGQGDMQRE